LASPFLSDYDATWVETSLTPELFGSTARPVTDLIGANQSFAVKFNGESIGFAVPEPGSGVLFATGLVALGAFLRWSRQAESDVRFFAGIDWGRPRHIRFALSRFRAMPRLFQVSRPANKGLRRRPTASLRRFGRPF
jgi:PEP-CTERM motif